MILRGRLCHSSDRNSKAQHQKKGRFDSHVVYWRLAELQGGASKRKGAGHNQVLNTNRLRLTGKADKRGEN